MIEGAREILKLMGVSNIDTSTLELIKSMEIQSILNKINQQKLPRELEYIVIQRIVGKYLNMLYSSGKLNLNALNLEPQLTSIKRGDVSMTYKEDSDTDKIKRVIEYLITFNDEELYSFRRIIW